MSKPAVIASTCSRLWPLRSRGLLKASLGSCLQLWSQEFTREPMLTGGLATSEREESHFARVLHGSCHLTLLLRGQAGDATRPDLATF